MKIIIHKELDRQKWDEFVFNHPDGNFFQSTFAYDFFDSVENHEPFALACVEDSEIIGLLSGVVMTNGSAIRRFLSKRAIIWGAPLISNRVTKIQGYEENEGERLRKKITKMLLKELNDYLKKKVIYTEFRNLFDTNEYKNIFLDNGYVYKEHLNYLVKTDNEIEVFRRFNESRRRQIRKSIKSGAEISEPFSVDEVRIFYDILKNLYKKKVNKPLPDFSYFENFFLNKKLGKIFLIKYKNKIVGGIVCAIYRDKIYELYVAGIEDIDKNIYPSVLSTFALIQYAYQNGLKYFDFMGAGKPDEDYGVREFKSKFGGELVNYGRYIKINKPLLYKTGKIGIKLMKIFS